MFAIPKIELVDSFNDVPFKVTLKRLTVPFKVEEPVNVVIPEVARNDEPLLLTSKALEILILLLVVIVPKMLS